MNANLLSQQMAANAASIAQYLLPSGKRKSGEWVAGNTSGDTGTSLSVRLTGAKAGVWADFATGEGGDLLDLWVKVRGLTVSEAMRDAKKYLNIRDSMPERQMPAYKRPARPRCESPKSGAMEWLTGRGLTPFRLEHISQ